MLVKYILEIIPSIIIYAVLYLIANKVQLFEPTSVPMVAGDELFNFSPPWILIYFSSYVSIPLSYLLIFNKISKRFIRSFLTLTIISFIIFMLFPTKVPRYDFDYSHMNFIFSFLFQVLHSADSPTNCIPSLHVSTAFLIFYLSLSMQRKLLIGLSFLYAILVSLSTLFVKQHLLLDVYSGFIAASLVYIFIRLLERNNG